MLVRELDVGGIERDVCKLARHLDRERFQPHVATFAPFGACWDELAAAGVPLLHIPVESVASKSAVRGARVLRTYLRAHEIMLVHSFDAPTNLFGLPVARLCGTPVLVSSQLWLGDFGGPVVSRLLRGVHHLADAVYVNCQAVADQVLENTRLPAHRVFVCHNGVETGLFYPRWERFDRTPTFPEVTIGTVALFRPEKDLSTLVHAFAHVNSLHPNTRLVLAGRGPQQSELDSLRISLRLQEVFEILPPPESVPDAMRSIDVFVSCSTSEAFSNALLEAMACGCCPVGSRVGGTPELIADGIRGLLFPPKDVDRLCAVLCTLVTNHSLRRRLSLAAATFAQSQLSIERAAVRLADTYASLLAAAGTSSSAKGVLRKQHVRP